MLTEVAHAPAYPVGATIDHGEEDHGRSSRRGDWFAGRTAVLVPGRRKPRADRRSHHWRRDSAPGARLTRTLTPMARAPWPGYGRRRLVVPEGGQPFHVTLLFKVLCAQRLAS